MTDTVPSEQLQRELTRALHENLLLQRKVKMYEQFYAEIYLLDLTKIPLGLLISIALRLNHGFLVEVPGETLEDRRKRIAKGLHDAQRAIEEITGTGFWSPERNKWYEEFYTELKYLGNAEEAGLTRANP